MAELEDGRSRRHRAGLEDILKMSSSIMARAGFHGTSMRELSRATGRSLAGLYHYFGSKEELLFLINYHGFTTLNETWNRVSDAFDAPQEQLYAFIYLHTHYYVSNMDEMRVMNWGTHDLELDRAMTVKKLKDTHAGDARRIVAAVHQATTGQRISGKRLARRTFLLFGMMNWIFGWYTKASHGAVDELVRDIYRTFMYGAGGSPSDDAEIDRIATLVGRTFRRSGSLALWEERPTNTPHSGRLT